MFCRVRDATKAGDKVTKAHKRLADSYIGVSAYVSLLSVGKDDPLAGYVSIAPFISLCDCVPSSDCIARLVTAMRRLE